MAPKTKSLKKTKVKDKTYPELEAKNRPYDKERYSTYVKESSRILYWLALVMLVIFNFLIFLLLVPLALILDPLQRTFMIGIIGLIFGLFFNFIVEDIEHLEPKHHFFAAITIPLVALVNLFIMRFMVNALRDIWNMPKGGNPWVEGIVYTVLFLLPYGISLVDGVRKRSS